MRQPIRFHQRLFQRAEGMNRPLPESYFHWMAHFLFLGALLMAAYFHLERNTGDPGWRIFYIINNSTVCPSHSRWVLAFVQVLPLMAVKAGLSMKTILVLHSIGPVLFFYVLYLFVAFRLRNMLASMVIVLISVFSIGEIYFHWSDLEKHLMAGLMITLYAMITVNRNKYREVWALIPVALFLILGSHPTSLVILPFLIGWSLYKKGRMDYYLIVWVILMILFNFTMADQYERTITGGFMETIYGFKGLTADQIQAFKGLLLHNGMVWLLIIGIVYSFIIKKRILPLACLALMVAVYFVMFVLLVPPQQYEPYMIPLVAMVVLIFISETKHLLLPKTAGLVFIGCLFICSMAYIWHNSEWAVEKVRLQKWMIESTEGQTGNRFLYRDEDLTLTRGDLITGYYYTETMIISALKGADKAIVAIPASQIISNLISIQDYIPDSVLDQHFPKDVDALTPEELPAYADTYFREDYFYGDFNLYFYWDLNPGYFDISEENFTWAQPIK